MTLLTEWFFLASYIYLFAEAAPSSICLVFHLPPYSSRSSTPTYLRFCPLSFTAFWPIPIDSAPSYSLLLFCFSVQTSSSFSPIFEASSVALFCSRQSIAPSLPIILFVNHLTFGNIVGSFVGWLCIINGAWIVEHLCFAYQPHSPISVLSFTMNAYYLRLSRTWTHFWEYCSGKRRKSRSKTLVISLYILWCWSWFQIL